jgi:hypothetical protein
MDQARFTEREHVHVTLDINVVHHFPDGVRLIHVTPPWLHTGLAINGTRRLPMPANLTVDDTNKKLHLQFYDDKNDTTNAPAGASASFGVTANADGSGGATTVAQDPNDPFAADITPGPDGDSGNFTATLSGAMEPDGSTAIPDPDPLPYTVGPGGAVSAQLSEG